MTNISKLDPEARYTVGARTVAWYYIGPEMQDEYDPDTGENVTEWSGYQVETGRVLMVMVGDDRPFAFDPEDCIPLDEDAYCASCGQVGCTADGRDRS